MSVTGQEKRLAAARMVANIYGYDWDAYQTIDSAALCLYLALVGETPLSSLLEGRRKKWECYTA